MDCLNGKLNKGVRYNKKTKNIYFPTGHMYHIKDVTWTMVDNELSPYDRKNLVEDMILMWYKSRTDNV